jgi:hypothetical protein
MYIMALVPVSTGYFINFSHPSVCLYVYPHIVARQRVGKQVRPQQMHVTIEDLLDASFSMGSVLCQRKGRD